MAQLSYPFETQDTTETQYSKLFSELQITGVAGDIQGGTSTGVRVAVGTGMNMELYAGFALIRGFAYENTDTVILTLDAATAQPRIDTIVLRLDPAANSIVAAVKKGTAAATPAAPALTQVEGGVWEMPLADMLIPASATALDINNYTDRRTFLGKGVGVWFTSSRPTTPTNGQIGYNRTTSKFEWYSTVTQTWSSVFPLETSGSRYTSVRQPASTSFQLQAADVGAVVLTTASTAVSLSVPTGLMETGQRTDIIQDGTGQVTISAQGGVTIQSKDNKFKISGRYGAASLVCVGTNTYRLIGDLAL